MKDALIKTYAAAEALASPFARLARRGVAVCVLACVGMGAAQAQYHGRRDEAQMQPPPSPRAERLPPLESRDRMGDQQRFFDQQREQARAEEQQRRQMQEAPQERRGGRMTPDERRDLRRQINEAGMDIYPNARRR